MKKAIAILFFVVCGMAHGEIPSQMKYTYEVLVCEQGLVIESISFDNYVSDGVLESCQSEQALSPKNCQLKLSSIVKTENDFPSFGQFCNGTLKLD